ncbi:hypothetical protein [uncultured Pseudoteredinibacter sp.]|uniref:hypothetical protein n=1 Tax=uncultured Pseudoteredinibacter sp. TaxID=1641701 RepID=UPI00260ADBDF|nr:hypothetical protein [uncultured Pseudoteredinibacter sp.]
MITYRKVAQLSREARGKLTKGDDRQVQLAAVKLEPHAEARVLALAEALHLPPEELVQQIMATALGDAHDGYLSAYPERKDRLKADVLLKTRVKELLESTEL